jgi:hypothetical protein
MGRIILFKLAGLHCEISLSSKQSLVLQGSHFKGKTKSKSREGEHREVENLGKTENLMGKQNRKVT